MLDLSLFFPLFLAASIFILTVVGIVIVLRVSLARSIARSHSVSGAPIAVPASDDSGAMRAAESI